jgi:AcrR family transcriptional regulator
LRAPSELPPQPHVDVDEARERGGGVAVRQGIKAEACLVALQNIRPEAVARQQPLRQIHTVGMLVNLDAGAQLHESSAMADSRPSLRAEHSEATRQALIASGRAAFGSTGYHEAGIESLARAARVSRGALYHHFRDKKALLDAVVVQIQSEAAAEIDTRARTARDPWRQLVQGVEAYFDMCQRPAYRRIVLEDAPSALGKARCAEIEGEYPLGWLRTKLRALQKAGLVANVNAATLASLLSAMISEGAAVLSSGGREATPDQVRAALHAMLDGVRRQGGRARRRQGS